MLRKLAEFSFALAIGFIAAQFAAYFYSQWYFGVHEGLRILLLTPLFGAAYLALLRLHSRRLWLFIGGYLALNYLLAAATAGSFDLQKLSFVEVLDYEAALVWVPILAVWGYLTMKHIRHERQKGSALRLQRRQLELRRRLRQLSSAGGSQLAVILLLLCISSAPALAAETEYKASGPGDRHQALYDSTAAVPPEWPAHLPEPLHMRKHKYFYISIVNSRDGNIVVHETNGQRLGELRPGDLKESVVGNVLAPVANINRKGFTASGWAPIGAVCASSVNAIHIKTDHNYNDGRGVIFSLVPIEFATFDPGNYKSYFNQSSTLFTNIKAGSEIFGGAVAPNVGNRLLVSKTGWRDAVPVEPGYVPADGDLIVIEVKRARFNPEWIEFENRYGGIIWIKEYELDAYPIGQVLKPVAGVGRFLGTQYADTGRVRAAHPGVIDISTTPMDSIGGFQIIPRDHAMSPEMVYARTKTQWMVVGPLWALDPSWEGGAPLFSDYLYPAYTPLSREADWEDIYLTRFTIKARYSDSEDPEGWEDVRETANLDNHALKDLTHLRIYFPIP